MLALVFTFLILAVACFVFGIFQMGDIGKLVMWHLAAGVFGMLASGAFLSWIVQRYFPAG